MVGDHISVVCEPDGDRIGLQVVGRLVWKEAGLEAGSPARPVAKVTD